MTLLKEKNIDLPKSEISKSAVEAALAALESLEFPTRKVEDWRYAKLGKILNKELSIAGESEVDLTEVLIEGLDAFQVVFVNGRLNKELSNFPSEEGVVAKPLNEVSGDKYNELAKDSKEIFTAINTAYVQEGLYLEVEKNRKLSKPIYVINLFSGTQAIANTRNLIVAQTGAEVDIIQGFYGIHSKEFFNNSLTEVYVHANAKVSIDKIQNLGQEDRQISSEEVYQENDSTFMINTFQLGGEFIRNGVNIKVDGTNCHTEMNGFFNGKGKQYLDNHTRVDHLKSNCISSELYKGILRDSSTGVFNGKVIVHQDAQVIEAYQQNNNVILSDNAVMNTKPELEIYADDVKCSHGTTTGQFDEQAIFYLQARGVSKSAAKEMLVAAFAEEVFEKVENESVVEFVRSLM
ncbi:Fe-S cluster assembly protein SufD [Parvicella tangerina]|uniref:FeS cluster assembly protein SufD n=1 Tax=Parvicella tangerina TaxID=2829795 RepID=A0A916JPH1_9FLAO|nr:Fe-S cluster assembly protein SufD [Parvicella tangerina]CAG5085376.1 FeS cluster assembly protein SufD [Parvicella tangerina]